MTTSLTFARLTKLKESLRPQDQALLAELLMLVRELAYELRDTCYNLDDEFIAGDGEEVIRAVLKKAKKATTPLKKAKP